MVFQYLRMTLIIFGIFTGTQGQNAPTFERLSFLLEEFCPGQDICLSNRSTLQFSKSDRTSCCKGCSCEDSCNLSKNCCFPKLTQDDDVPEVLKSPKFYHETCLYPFTPLPDGQKKVDKTSYRMVSSVEESSSPESCGYKIVASWGSLFPVYSKQKDLIFKNSACAEAYNVEDGILWPPFLICQAATADTKSKNDGATFVIQPGMNMSDDCYVYFQPPEDELESHVCHIAEDFIQTCPTYFEYSLPAYLNLDKEELESACTSGLLAPYKFRKMYANVFCFICNENFFSERATCSKFDPGVQFAGSDEQGGFIGLLNTDYPLLADKDTTGRKTMRTACRRSCSESGENACCREILCPSGKSRDSRGNCYFPTKIWYNTEYEVVVEISVPRGIDIQSMFTTEGALDVFKRTWPSHWYIFQIFHEAGIVDGSMSRNIVVSLKVPFRDGPPDILIQNVQSVMRRQWGLFVDNQLIPIKPDFYKLSFYHKFGVDDSLNETLVEISPNVTKILDLPNLTKIYHIERAPGQITPFFITKLYYCEQVELLDSEYIMPANGPEDFIYNKITGKFVFNGDRVYAHQQEWYRCTKSLSEIIRSCRVSWE